MSQTVQKLYEDNVSGKVSDEWFLQLASRYETERMELKTKIGSIRDELSAMDRFTAHQLRHTYATMLYDAGVDVKTAQDFLGHADPTVTMNIYTHLSSQKKEKAVQALQQHFADTIPEAL